LPSLAPFGQAVSEEKIFLTLTNKKKELIFSGVIALFYHFLAHLGIAITWRPSSIR
jgi:hypothetical protein